MFVFQYSGCSAVGYNSSGSYRYVLVNDMLDSITSMLHAMFHILGRYHEHQRTDRGLYLSVKKESIMAGIVPTYCAYTGVHVGTHVYMISL